MTEDDARAWVAGRHGQRAIDTIERFVDMVVDENTRQNLIAPSTISSIWARHIVDSAQLLAFDRAGETWCDVGTGGGFPGMIVALLRDAPVVMVEPRKRRAAFLADCAALLGLVHATIVADKVERWQGRAGIVSARAVASIDALFASARHCTGAGTRWILPKGRTAMADLREARTSWRGVFHVEPSVVEAEAGIVIAEEVQRR